jgi:hypothetical protein
VQLGGDELHLELVELGGLLGGLQGGRKLEAPAFRLHFGFWQRRRSQAAAASVRLVHGRLRLWLFRNTKPRTMHMQLPSTKMATGTYLYIMENDNWGRP